jgi:hypothetical protein
MRCGAREKQVPNKLALTVFTSDKVSPAGVSTWGIFATPACPNPSLPQQVTGPLTSFAHAWYPPAAI